jgi:glycosyltransferase involved in cell wall biosynthesis
MKSFDLDNPNGEIRALCRVTVVMAVYNAARFLREAVESVLAQTYHDFELIVVEDSSSDDSLAILQSFADRRIRIIRHQTNMGAAVSRNDALAAARGELVAIMDADDVCAPTRLERQAAFLDANSEVGLVGCGIYDNIDTSGVALQTSHLPEDNEAIQQTLMQRWCFLHSSIMFRKRLFERVGGYRKEFEPAEDHDLVLRMMEHCPAHNLHEPLVSYRLNPQGLTVIGHQYVRELGEVAIRLAQRRRSGQPENIDTEMAGLLELKRRRQAPRGLAGVVQSWRDSLYAANRYYGLGCRELCAGRLERARRCFVRSLGTNGLFVKSWIGIALSLIPFAATRLRFMFRSSMRQHTDLSWLPSSVNETLT